MHICARLMCGGIALTQDVQYGPEGALGVARTWPQHACALPTPADAFDWEGDRPLNTPLEDLVVYEMHVRGFTWDKSSGVGAPGKPLISRYDGESPAVGTNALAWAT